MVHILGTKKRSHTPDVPDCPICHKDMVWKAGKKGAIWACYRCEVAIAVTDPIVLHKNLWLAGTMMKTADKVIIGQLEWEVVIVKGDRDVLIRRPNPKDKTKMDFAIIEVVDFVFDKEKRTWIEVETLPEDGSSLFKSK